jgi:NAD(P)-dependent dehydrogenase (short-subunit alcohol dehydrogenase family)
MPPHPKFNSKSTAEQVSEGMNLDGKIYLVTGCNSGLGLETVRVLLMRGATVIGAARTVEKAKTVLDTVGQTDKFIPIECELSKPSSAKNCVAELLSKQYVLQGIIGNAGIMALPKLELVEGYEAQFFTNHIGHFILVTGILPLLAEDGRVVMLSSMGNTFAPKEGVDFDNLDGSKSYSPWTAYGRSKVCTILCVRS